MLNDVASRYTIHLANPRTTRLYSLMLSVALFRIVSVYIQL